MKVGELKIVNRELGEMIDERINTNNGVENEEQEINLYALFFKYSWGLLPPTSLYEHISIL